MAAHSVNILLELASSLPFCPEDEDREEACGRYLAALGYAPGMDELEPGDWNRLRVALEGYRTGDYSGDAVRVLAIRILGHQITAWECLGGPRCHEDWMQAKYPGEEE